MSQSGPRRCHTGSSNWLSIMRNQETLCAYLLLREKIIKPLLAGTARLRGRPPKVHTTLDQHYVALREELSRTFQTIGLAVS